MISLIEGVTGMISLIVVAKGMKSNTQFFCQQLVSNLKSNISSGTHRKTMKGHQMDFNNAPAHNPRSFNQCLEATNPRRVAHQGYSPDPAPSNFFQFGLLKEKLQGIALTHEEDLISRIQAILDKVPESILILVEMT
jgi:hypothetical protein